MKRLFFFILPVFLFLGCEVAEEPGEGQTSQTAAAGISEDSEGALQMGSLTEDVMEEMSGSETEMLEAERADEEKLAARAMEGKILKEATQNSGMVVSVPDGERERIINENRWGYSVRNLDAGSTMYYDRNGNFLGKRLQ